jgi:hypothetical protein
VLPATTSSVCVWKQRRKIELWHSVCLLFARIRMNSVSEDRSGTMTGVGDSGCTIYRARTTSTGYVRLQPGHTVRKGLRWIRTRACACAC